MKTFFTFQKSARPRYVVTQSITSLVISLSVTAVSALLLFYFFLPALNIKSLSFWLLVIFLILEYIIVKNIVCTARKETASYKNSFAILGIVITIVFVGLIVGAKIWNAHAYASLLQVQMGDISDIPSAEGTSSIALMDTASAEKLGDREIGSLTDVVSQFNVGEYFQIDYQSAPVKIAPLQYEGFFKWAGNHEKGIPGYVIVNPVSMSADYSSLNEGMKYVPSAYFNENLKRRLRFAYPFTMFGNIHFEVDEDGNPWYVASVFDHSISLFGGTKVTGAILINPVSGQMQKLDVQDVPKWIDVVYPGDLITKQYNYFAKLQRGFWNSIFGQIDCRQTTTVEVKDEDGDSSFHFDYGYIAKDGDVWIFTGVTSVNGDSSNLGFIMANERTSETKYITCSGADEGSAMHSAEGEVQEKGYHASFPSLINIDGIPTYIMVLKDDNGLVKMYACVNVEQYNLVVTATTQKDVVSQYRRFMKGELSEEEVNQSSMIQLDTSSFVEKTIIVNKLEKIDENGNTYLYILSDDGNIYRAKYADVLGMITVNIGDEIKIYTDGTSYLLEK